MNGKEIYKIYAPIDAKWTEWVRPVPFVAIDTYDRKPDINWVDRKVMFLSEYNQDTAIFVDLLGKESIEMGIALAYLGYRPIPIFNGTDEQQGAQATIDTYLVENYLINASRMLKNIKLKNDANPAFLLDSSRTNRYRAKESIFDNSWDLYKQDIPSVQYFKSNKINKIIVVGNEIQRDLRKIFFEFQDAGIEFYLTNGYSSAQKIILKKTLKEKFEKEEL